MGMRRENEQRVLHEFTRWYSAGSGFDWSLSEDEVSLENGKRFDALLQASGQVSRAVELVRLSMHPPFSPRGLARLKEPYPTPYLAFPIDNRRNLSELVRIVQKKNAQLPSSGSVNLLIIESHVPVWEPCFCLMHSNDFMKNIDEVFFFHAVQDREAGSCVRRIYSKNAWLSLAKGGLPQSEEDKELLCEWVTKIHEHLISKPFQGQTRGLEKLADLFWRCGSVWMPDELAQSIRILFCSYFFQLISDSSDGYWDVVKHYPQTLMDSLHPDCFSQE
jgi:hypothetical protein